MRARTWGVSYGGGHSSQRERRDVSAYAGAWSRNRRLCRRRLPGRGQGEETRGTLVNWHVAMRPGKRKEMDKSTPLSAN